MKPWLVTGAAGFIGARMVERLNQEQVPVVSVDVLRFFDERTEHRGLDFGKRIDRDQLMDWLKSEKPELAGVIHLGASSSTAEKNWEFLNRVNVQYSKDLWDYCKAQGLPFLYASSAATYGDGGLGFTDDESQMSGLKPLNPYGESKRLFDLWAIEQEKLGQHPPAWAGFKFFNVYGFGERHKTGQSSPILPFFDQARTQGNVRLFKSHRPEIRDGEQRRDFIAVNDVIDVLEFARKGGLRRGIYNLGTGQARTFLDLSRAVFQALGLPEQIEFIDTPAAFREGYQYFTEARMEKLTAQGYRKPFTPLEVGVKEYVERLKATISD
jgi:ADP-L-glycero-D-manno-heptose 6-epimerase